MDTTNQEQQILELERQYWQALKDGDIGTAKKLTDFPCIITGPQGMGSVDAQAFEVMMKKMPYTIERFRLDDDAQVRMLSDDVAVIAYKVQEELTVDGEPVRLEATDSSTWIRRNGEWLCAHHTEALKGDPFGRDRAAPRA